ncbi:MAG: oligosaccharide flippase family protein [Candidatus Limnocylindrales bacterium]
MTDSTLTRDVLKSGASRVLAYGVSLVSVVLVSRAMGPAGKGAISLGTAIPGITAILFGLGLGTSTTMGLRERWLDHRWALMTVTLYAMAAGTASVALGVLYLGVTAGGDGYGLAIAVATAAPVGALLLTDYCGGLLQGAGAVSGGMWLRQSVGIGQSAIAIILIVFGARDPLPILIGMAIWAWGCGVVGCVLVLSSPCTSTAEAGRGWLRRMIRVGIQAQAVSALLLLNYRLDMVLLGLLGSVAQVGIYSVAVGFSEVAWFGVNALAAVLLPHISGVDSSVACTRTASAARLAIASTMLLSAAVAIGLELLVVPVFGIGFRQSTPSFLAITPGLITFALFKCLSLYGIATHQMRAVSSLAAVGLALNVCANLVLIPRMGSIGAALSSSISYSATSILAAAWFLHGTGLGFRALIPLSADWAVVLTGGRMSRGRQNVS